VYHPVTGEEAKWPGEAKIAGRAIPAQPADSEPAESGADSFTADISEIVITHLNPEATLLVVESWTPQRGLRVIERE
jgi:hypothetical protein